jgi:hypothetical protein
VTKRQPTKRAATSDESVFTQPLSREQISAAASELADRDPQTAKGMVAAMDRWAEFPSRPQLAACAQDADESSATTAIAGDDTAAKTANMALMMSALGSASPGFRQDAISALANAVGYTPGSDPFRFNAALAVLAAVEPRDELEAALAVQMIGNHYLAVEMTRRAGRAERADHLQTYGGLAVKLQRTFTAQMEALAKLRSGGKQQVEVRYVYIDARNQTLVGGQGGGGDSGQSGGQSHAAPALPFGPGAEVWGAHAPGQELCGLPGQRQAPLPDAWRHEPRSPEGPAERELAGRLPHPRGGGSSTPGARRPAPGPAAPNRPELSNPRPAEDQ